MTEIEELLEIEKIRKTRILYSHYFDSNELDKLSSLFTEDAICEFGERGTWIGRPQIRKNYEAAHDSHEQRSEDGSYPYLHAITNHWIELTGPDSAEGRCYLIDMLTVAEKTPILLIGCYDDEYKKVDGAWKIHRTRIDFLWPDRDMVGGAPGKRIPPKV